MNIDKKKGFLGNFIILASGSGLAQIIAFLVSPILTRLYTPEEFGSYAVFLSLASILTVTVTLRLEYSILSAKDDQSASDSGYSTVSITILLSLFATIILASLSFFDSSFISTLQLNSLWYYVSLLTITLALSQVLLLKANREKKFQRIATYHIIRQSINSSIQLGLGWLNLLNEGLIWGKLLGEITGLIFLLPSRIVAKIRLILNRVLDYRKLHSTINEYSHFTKYYLTHAIINVLAANLLIIFIQLFFSTAITGQFSLAFRILFGPLQIITYSFAQVINSKLSELQNETKKRSKFLYRLILIHSVGTIIIFLPVYFYAPQLFTYIFGSGWNQAGQFGKNLAPLTAAVFLVSPYSFLPQLLKESKKALLFEISYVTMRYIGLAIGIMLSDSFLAIQLYALLGIIPQLTMFGWYIRITPKLIPE